MPINLHGRSVLTLDDFTPDEIRLLLRLASALKAARLAGSEVPRLAGKNIALIFEKDSTRTRTGFEVAAHDQEGKTNIAASPSQRPRRWRCMQAFRSITGSPMRATPPRRWPT